MNKMVLLEITFRKVIACSKGNAHTKKSPLSVAPYLQMFIIGWNIIRSAFPRLFLEIVVNSLSTGMSEVHA